MEVETNGGWDGGSYRQGRPGRKNLNERQFEGGSRRTCGRMVPGTNSRRQRVMADGVESELYPHPTWKQDGASGWIKALATGC